MILSGCYYKAQHIGFLFIISMIFPLNFIWKGLQRIAADCAFLLCALIQIQLESQFFSYIWNFIFFQFKKMCDCCHLTDGWILHSITHSRFTNFGLQSLKVVILKKYKNVIFFSLNFQVLNYLPCYNMSPHPAVGAWGLITDFTLRQWIESRLGRLYPLWACSMYTLLASCLQCPPSDLVCQEIMAQLRTMNIKLVKN